MAMPRDAFVARSRGLLCPSVGRQCASLASKSTTPRRSGNEPTAQAAFTGRLAPRSTPRPVLERLASAQHGGTVQFPTPPVECRAATTNVPGGWGRHLHDPAAKQVVADERDGGVQGAGRRCPRGAGKHGHEARRCAAAIAAVDWSPREAWPAGRASVDVGNLLHAACPAPAGTCARRRWADLPRRRSSSSAARPAPGPRVRRDTVRAHATARRLPQHARARSPGTADLRPGRIVSSVGGAKPSWRA